MNIKNLNLHTSFFIKWKKKRIKIASPKHIYQAKHGNKCNQDSKNPKIYKA